MTFDVKPVNGRESQVEQSPKNSSGSTSQKIMERLQRLSSTSNQDSAHNKSSVVSSTETAQGEAIPCEPVIQFYRQVDTIRGTVARLNLTRSSQSLVKGEKLLEALSVFARHIAGATMAPVTKFSLGQRPTTSLES